MVEKKVSSWLKYLCFYFLFEFEQIRHQDKTDVYFFLWWNKTFLSMLYIEQSILLEANTLHVQFTMTRDGD